MMTSTKDENRFHQTLRTWPEFRNEWGGLHNFLMEGELVDGFAYDLPPIERIIDEVRQSPHAIVRSGIKQDEFDLTSIKEQFVRLPIAEAMRSRFVLAHFGLHPHLTGKGQVFEDLDEKWVEPWRKKLLAHGFTFDNVFAILFASGPDSASNYHMDYTHQLAWQRYGTKHFCGLRDPDRWTTAAQRGRCELKGSTRPKQITQNDVYNVVQPPGSVLWNAHTTPHWVETSPHDGCAVTLTLVHDHLRLNGKRCPHAEALEQWREANNYPERQPQDPVGDTDNRYAASR
jgi:hypothetical protein